ncbi:shikimate kinase [Caminibacter pacificus]
MQVDNNMSPTSMMVAIQTDVIKKSEDTVKNIVGDILEKNFENTMKIEQQVAAATGAGANLNIKA